ncbi:MAG: LysM peptidoglycan-binding domain-containing protein [Ruminococcus sp.]|nr:LysM peptidoglycan-binding domain-containing protein [Ruminococcus sp.]
MGDGSRYMEIKALNNLKSNIIHVGDVLEIPES